jgi:hypothetical protein
MQLQELKQLLAAKLNGSTVQKAQRAFSLLSAACGSSDVYVMLQSINSMVQRLRGTVDAGTAALAPSTAKQYVMAVAWAVQQIPELQQLLSDQQLQALQEELVAAKRQFDETAAAADERSIQPAEADDDDDDDALQASNAALPPTLPELLSKAGSSAAAAAAAGHAAAHVDGYGSDRNIWMPGLKRHNPQQQQQQQVST